MRARALLACLTLLTASFGLLAAPAAGAAPSPSPIPTPASAASNDSPRVTFGATPASATTSDTRPYLSYGLGPSSDVLDYVAVFNQSDSPLRLTIYGADAVNAGDGGFDVVKRAERNKDMGSWLTVGRDAMTPGLVRKEARSETVLTVPAQSSERGVGRVIVPVRITVPSDATPGDHAGGIAISLVTLGKNSRSQNIELEQRVVVRAYVQVTGDLLPGLTVKLLKADYEGGSGLGLSGVLKVTYRITNTGNVRLAALSRVRVRGPFGWAEQRIDGPKLDELVPGGFGDVTATVTDVPPTILTWATVTVEAAVAPGGKAYEVEPASATARVWAVTWQEVVLLLSVVALTVWRRLRRRSRATAPQPAVQPVRGRHAAPARR